jgi:hypothetical protein
MHILTFVIRTGQEHDGDDDDDDDEKGQKCRSGFLNA